MKKIYNLIIYTALSIQINAQILPDVKVTDNGTFNARVVDGVGEVSFLDYKNYVLKGSWLHSGNAGTNAATHFIGTTDAQPLVFKTNNVIRARLLVNDNNFFGINSGNLTGTGTNNNFFGNGTGANFTTGANNNFIGYLAGAFNTTGGNNNFLGSGAGYNNTTGSNNNFNGNGAGLSNISGGNNNFNGNNAGYKNTTGSDNNFFGTSAGYNNTTGGNNNFNGNGAGFRNTEGANNNFNGNGAGAFNATGSDNNFFGTSAGYANTTGSDNIMIGTNAGINISNAGNVSGNGNIYLGENAVGHDLNGSNQISINNLIYANQIQNVGIGIANPAEKLEVNGKIKTNGVTIDFPSTPSILQDNFIGTFSALSNNFSLKSISDVLGNSVWKTTGQAVSLTDWIGSTNANPLIFKINSVQKMKLTDTDLEVGSGGNNEYTSRLALKSWGGSATENVELIHSGSIGLRINLPTTTSEINGYFGNATKAFLWNSSGINFLAAGQTVTGLKTTGATGSDAISVTQADATYAKNYISGTINLTNPAMVADDLYYQDVTVTGAVVGDIVVVEQIGTYAGASGIINGTNGRRLITGVVKSANTVQIQLRSENGGWFANTGNVNFKVLK